MADVFYTGRRLRNPVTDEADTASGVEVKRDKDILSPKPSQKIRNHSPDGFNWGYGGSGPAQLALALLLDATGDKKTAEKHYQRFKADYISGLQDEWTIRRSTILEWLQYEKDYRSEVEGNNYGQTKS